MWRLGDGVERSEQGAQDASPIGTARRQSIPTSDSQYQPQIKLHYSTTSIATLRMTYTQVNR
jgi:hypothetical protein